MILYIMTKKRQKTTKNELFQKIFVKYFLSKGRMTNQELGKLYGGRIEDNSILCTDSHKSYMQFAIDID